MKALKLCLLAALAAASSGALADADFLLQRSTLEFPPALQATPAHAALYSFADVYRLTVGGAALAAVPQASADYPVRVAVTEPQAAGYVFSIAAVKQPESWLLLLSGIALAGWVARRRLNHAF